MSQLINTLYTLNEREWNIFLQAEYPDATLMKWTPFHRVYLSKDKKKSTILKIERKLENPETLKEEYEIHKRISGSRLNLNPSLKCDLGGWIILEMDYVEGPTFTQLFQQSGVSFLDLIKVIALLLIASTRGVYYRQFRPRHIIKTISGSIFFIDFGKSSIKNPIEAFIRNFNPITVSRQGIRLGAIPSLLSSYVKQFRKKGKKKSGNSHNALNRIMTIGFRNVNDGPSAFHKLGVKKSHIELLTKFERKSIEAVTNFPSLAPDFYEIKILSYGFPGAQDFGFIWHYLEGRLDLPGSSFVDWYGCQGIAATFAALCGSSVTYWDPNPDIMKAHKLFVQAFGVRNNSIKYSRSLPNDGKPIIIFLLSSRPRSIEDLDLKQLIQMDQVTMICGSKHHQYIYSQLKYGFKLDIEVVKSFDGHLLSIMRGTRE